MAIHITTRHASHPEDVRHYNTQQLRDHFLLDHLFEAETIKGVYSAYDRLIVGGIHPVNEPLALETVDQLKAGSFLERRELGIVNIGSPATITVEGRDYHLDKKEALYIGKGTGDVVFHPPNEGKALLYFNATPAHRSYPTRKIGMEDAEHVETGSMENSNHRIIHKLIVHSILPTCQLQMGLTELKPGSVWNTMPAHVHDRRMEAYFYFDLAEDQVVCHYMGEPTETRHVWLKNNQAIISPPWSIHSGSGTSNYSFVWGMAGENLDYGDMDMVLPTELR